MPVVGADPASISIEKLREDAGAGGAAPGIEGGTRDEGREHRPVVRLAKDALVKARADGRHPLDRYPHPEGVSRAQRPQVVDLDPRDNEMHALPHQRREIDPAPAHEDVAGVLEVVLVDGVVHDALHVALIVTHLEWQAEGKGVRIDLRFHGGSQAAAGAADNANERNTGSEKEKSVAQIWITGSNHVSFPVMKKNKIIPILLGFIAAAALTSGLHADSHHLEGKRVAVIIAEGFHDGETLSPIIHLREYGVEIDILSTAKGPISAYNSNVSIDIDKTLADVDAESYHAVILPGGGGPAKLRENHDVLRFMQAFAATGRPIAAICHGPQVLASAGLLENVETTCFPGIADEMTEAGARHVDREVSVDGQFITSRLPKDLPAFNKAIVDALAGRL